MQASASLACRKGDGRFRSKTDFSAFLSYVAFGSRPCEKALFAVIRAIRFPAILRGI